MKQWSPSIATLLVALVSLNGCATGMDPIQGVLTDPEIAQIVMNANQGEIEQGQIATTRAASSAVRDFARMLIQDHTAANQRANELASRENITPVSNELSREMVSNASRAAETLGTWRGAEFDRVFMETQIEFHQWLLSTIDENLIPSVQNRELRVFLETQRGSVASHLARARQIRSTL